MHLFQDRKITCIFGGTLFIIAALFTVFLNASPSEALGGVGQRLAAFLCIRKDACVDNLGSLKRATQGKGKLCMGRDCIVHPDIQDSDGDKVFDNQDWCVNRKGEPTLKGCPRPSIDSFTITGNIEQTISPGSYRMRYNSQYTLRWSSSYADRVILTKRKPGESFWSTETFYTVFDGDGVSASTAGLLGPIVDTRNEVTFTATEPMEYEVFAQNGYTYSADPIRSESPGSGKIIVAALRAYPEIVRQAWTMEKYGCGATYTLTMRHTTKINFFQYAGETNRPSSPVRSDSCNGNGDWKGECTYSVYLPSCGKYNILAKLRTSSSDSEYTTMTQSINVGEYQKEDHNTCLKDEERVVSTCDSCDATRNYTCLKSTVGICVPWKKHYTVLQCGTISWFGETENQIRSGPGYNNTFAP